MIYPAPTRLTVQLQALGIPVDGVVQNADGSFTVQYNAAATPAQITQGDTLASNYDARTYVGRLLADIYQGLQALTTTQHANAWNDVSAATAAVPRKYLGDPGGNAASIFTLDWIIYVQKPTAAQLTAAQKNLLAQYVQDNPAYLIGPAFDTTINVPGWQPAV